MHDGTYNMALAASLNMDMRAAKAHIAALEQLCKDAAHLMETAPFGAITNSAGELDWFARYDNWKQRLEQEVTE